ncbi:MAG: GNAT family N-acetyltransferase [Hyphomicrobiales bacterium]|nr:GNAT family N-acetyltransferase [Hyphomicrobiales bacterium]
MGIPIDSNQTQNALAHLPPSTRAIDTFIGEPEMINAGHGSGYLRAMARLPLDNGAFAVVIDPEPDNARARRAYHKAGFVRVEKRTTSECPAIVMHFVPETD